MRGHVGPVTGYISQHDAWPMGVHAGCRKNNHFKRSAKYHKKVTPREIKGKALSRESST